MAGFLDRLLKRFSGREVDLPFDPGPHLRNVDGFLRPDWAALRALVAEMPEDGRPAAWSAVAKRWLREQAPLLHPSFAVHESEHLLLLSALTPGRARLLLEYAEGALPRILKDVGGAGRIRGEGPLAVLHGITPTVGYTRDEEAYCMEHVVGHKGQIVIEKGIRDRLGIGPGWRTVQRLVGNRVEVSFLPPRHRRSLLGVLGPEVTRLPEDPAEEEAAWEREAVREWQTGEHVD